MIINHEDAFGLRTKKKKLNKKYSPKSWSVFNDYPRTPYCIRDVTIYVIIIKYVRCYYRTSCRAVLYLFIVLLYTRAEVFPRRGGRPFFLLQNYYTLLTRRRAIKPSTGKYNIRRRRRRRRRFTYRRYRLLLSSVSRRIVTCLFEKKT